MNLYEQKQFRRLEEEIMRKNLEITELKYERERRQRQLMEFIDATIELLQGFEGKGLTRSNILAYYQARRGSCRK